MLLPHSTATNQPWPSDIWEPTQYRLVSEYVQRLEGVKLLGRWHPCGSETVLDVGSGDGALTAFEIAFRVPEGSVWGLDSDAEMIKSARATYPEQWFTNLRWQLGDIRTLRQLDTETFTGQPGFVSVIFSNSCLHHIHDWEGQTQALQSMHSLMRPGGRLLLSFAGEGNFSELRTALDEVAATPRFRPYFESFSYPLLLPGCDMFYGVMRLTGWSHTTIERETQTFSFPDESALAGWIRYSVASYIRRLSNCSEALKRSFAEAAATQYVKNSGGNSGDVKLQSRNLIVEATKV
jgi:trans-aconitate methyltransferase